MSQSIDPVQTELRNLQPTTEPSDWCRVKSSLDAGRAGLRFSDSLPCDPGVLADLAIPDLGMHAPLNPTVIGGLLVCAVSVAAAVFLIVNMAHPYVRFIHVSDGPLRAALAHLGQRQAR
jgi:hypothetical protein